MKLRNKKGTKNYINIFIIGTIGYIFIILFKMNILKSGTQDITYLILDLFGNLNIKSDTFTINYGLYLYNFILILYITSSYIYDDFYRNAVYVFTRTGNKRGWTQEKLKKCFIIITKYFLLQYIVTVVIGISGGFRIENVGSFFVITGITFIQIVLNVIEVSLLTNIIAFKSGNEISYAVGVGIVSITTLFVYIGNLFYIPKKIYGLMPVISGITSWYPELNNIINRKIYEFEFYMVNNSLVTNVIITCGLIIILQKILKKMVCNTEVL